MSTKEEIIDWLRDAYAMERGLEIMLNKQSQNDELHAELRAQARVHLEETKRHAALVEECLKVLGSDTSTIKTGGWQAMEALKGASTNFARDERVKDLLAAYASEHFEIACYRALTIAAQQAGLPQVAAACEEIIFDERNMARWIDENLPVVVSSYLSEVAAGAA